jgi:hypothetical protein
MLAWASTHSTVILPSCSLFFFKTWPAWLLTAIVLDIRVLPIWCRYALRSMAPAATASKRELWSSRQGSRQELGTFDHNNHEGAPVESQDTRDSCR